MKKLLIVLLVCLLSALSLTTKSLSLVYADESACKFEDDEEAYYRCLKEERTSLSNRIKEAQLEQEGFTEIMNEAKAKMETLEAEIAELEPQIEELEIRIEELEISIAENEAKVEALRERILARMKEAQATMHFNPWLDFILGSNGFADMLRRTYGVEAITKKEEKDRLELIEIIEKLNADKKECDEAKLDLDEKMKKLQSDKVNQQLIQEEYRIKVQELENYIEELSAQLDMVKKQLSVTYNLNLLDYSSGFISPIPGARAGQGVPYYSDGSKHLGIDYNGVGYGTAILAPADGVVISTVNGCTKDRGNNYGNACPYGTSEQSNGSAYLGNQARFITSVNGYVYGFLFCHMLAGSVTSTGNIYAGDTIGLVGSSGNSTGAHCHIEMFYLGKGEIKDLDKYIDKYGGYNGFGTVYTVSSFCAYKGGAPCRLDPRNYLGVKEAELEFDFY